MRYYLDTNILVYLVTKDYDNLAHDVQDILTDYSNTLLTSSVCVHEFIQLAQIGKIFQAKNDKRNAESVLPLLRASDIGIVYTNEQHLEQMAAMPVKHSDPYDRLIIAQAINDRIPVVSSDNKFKDYCKYGLEFVFNLKSATIIQYTIKGRFMNR